MSQDVVVVPQAQAGWRLDRVLTGLASVGSRRRAREAVETGKVFVDGRLMSPEEAGLPLPEGAKVEVRWNRPGTGAERRKAEVKLEAAGLRILYADEAIVAVDKPPGLLTDVADQKQARERDSVKKRLAAWLGAQGKDAHVCHRIDRDTSGVVLFATHDRAAEVLREQFANHQPTRVYRCWVHGWVEGDAGVWEDATRWDRDKLRLVRVNPRADGAMPTRATWRVLERFACGVTALEVQLDTGRRNQIRLQASLRGHPLLGERVYLPPRFDIGTLRLPRQALHAWSVAVRHPTRGGEMRFEAPLPADLRALSGRLAQLPPPETVVRRRRYEVDDDDDDSTEDTPFNGGGGAAGRRAGPAPKRR